MRNIEIERAVRTCSKCGKCYRGMDEEVCPMYQEFEIAPFSPPGVFYMADGILNGHVEISVNNSVVPFSCNMCGACKNRCVSSDLHFCYEYPTKLIESIRGLFVEEGEIPEKIAEVFRSLDIYKNAWQLPSSKRVEWETDNEITIPDYTKERNEFLLYVGDASLIPETQHIPRNVSKLLKKGGVDFGTLKEQEFDSGNEARAMGERGLFEELAQQNINTFEKFSVKKIITISPHDYFTFQNDYPKLGMESVEVYHYTQLLSKLIKEQKIKLTKEIAEIVTFQDPCHLGRYSGIYETPREIIRAIPGTKIIEMQRSKDYAFCCGAGGGRMWYENDKGRKRRIADVRIAHAKEVGATIIATACPYCLNNLQGTENSDEISIQSIEELVLKSLS